MGKVKWFGKCGYDYGHFSHPADNNWPTVLLEMKKS